MADRHVRRSSAGHARARALSILGLAIGLAAGACGTSAPEQVSTELPLDLAEITGSWTATVKDEQVWQGRWELHIQGQVALLRGPDRRFLVPGLVEAAGRGAVLFGKDEACGEQRRAVGAGSYIYEVHGDDLRFRLDGEDTCPDRLAILTDGPWTRILQDPALPVRVDVGADAGCASLDDGSAAGALPRTWQLHNQTNGMVVVIARTSDGDEAMLAQATAGEDVEVSPRRGGIWYVADLAGRCLALVGDVTGVTLRTGARPRFEGPVRPAASASPSVGPSASRSAAPSDPPASSSPAPSASG